MKEYESTPQFKGPEIDDAESSGYITGLIGALLGAAVGTIPWVLVAYFAHLYVGWLGFLVGWVSVFGYKLLKGVKKTGYATAVVFICSIVCIIAAEFGIYAFALFSEPEVVAAVEALGMTKLQALQMVLTDPEVLPEVIKDFAIALVIGILGLVSARSQIKAYTIGPLPEATVPGQDTIQQ